MTIGNDRPGPLDGLRVLDLTSTFMGPYTTLMLASMGADVIKVEPPEGDIVRRIGDGRHEDMGPIFLAVNQGKRSVSLDLKSEHGKQAFDRLLSSSDVFVTNVRASALDRLGLNAERVSALNRSLIYARLAGFGSSGPYRRRAAYDDVIQALSGVAATQGTDSPSYIKSAVADKTVGLMAVGAILAAVIRRHRTGIGEVIEVPMFEAMTQFHSLEQQGGLVFDPPNGPSGYARTSSAHRRPYRTQDGYIGVVVYTDRQWMQFFKLIGEPDLINDPRFASIADRTRHIDELYQLLADVLTRQPSGYWIEMFDEVGIPATPVLSIDDLYADPHLDVVEFWRSIDHPTEGKLRLPRFPISFSGGQTELRPSPGLGEHSREVMAETGLTGPEIDVALNQ